MSSNSINSNIKKFLNTDIEKLDIYEVKFNTILLIIASILLFYYLVYLYNYNYKDGMISDLNENEINQKNEANSKICSNSAQGSDKPSDYDIVDCAELQYVTDTIPFDQLPTVLDNIKRCISKNLLLQNKLYQSRDFQANQPGCLLTRGNIADVTKKINNLKDDYKTIAALIKTSDGAGDPFDKNTLKNVYSKKDLTISGVVPNLTLSECRDQNSLPNIQMFNRNSIDITLSVKKIRDKHKISLDNEFFEVKWKGPIPNPSNFKIAGVELNGSKPVNDGIVTIKDIIKGNNKEKTFRFHNFNKNGSTLTNTRSPYIKAYNDIRINHKIIEEREDDKIRYDLDRGRKELYFKPVIGRDLKECKKFTTDNKSYDISYEDMFGVKHTFSKNNPLKDIDNNDVYKKYYEPNQDCDYNYNNLKIEMAINDDKLRRAKSDITKEKYLLKNNLQKLYKFKNDSGGCTNNNANGSSDKYTFYPQSIMNQQTKFFPNQEYYDAATNTYKKTDITENQFPKNTQLGGKRYQKYRRAMNIGYFDRAPKEHIFASPSIIQNRKLVANENLIIKLTEMISGLDNDINNINAKITALNTSYLNAPDLIQQNNFNIALAYANAAKAELEKKKANLEEILKKANECKEQGGLGDLDNVIDNPCNVALERHSYGVDPI